MKHFKTTSKAGAERKFNRLLAQELAKRHPEIYADLAALALDKIKSDNAAVNTPINTWGVGARKKPSPLLVTAIIKNHEIRNNFAYGEPDVTPNTQLSRLLSKETA